MCFLNFSLTVAGNKILNVSKFASWACWEDARSISDNEKLKFPETVDSNFLKKVNANIIFVGLNISRDIKDDWSNFHDTRRGRNDARLRWAIQKNELFKGAYMTDLIKGLRHSSSDYVKGYFQENGTSQNQKSKEGYSDKEKDKAAGTFVSLEKHGDNFYEEMKQLEALEAYQKEEKVLLIFLGVHLERDFLNKMLEKSEKLRNWKNSLGNRLLIRSIQNHAVHNNSGESEKDFRTRYCQLLSDIAEDFKNANTH